MTDSEKQSTQLVAERHEVVEQNEKVLVESERSRATEEVQAMLVIAKRFPRDEIKAESKVITACQRKSLAERATYLYPRGGEKVTGPSIRLAEVLAQNWGNLEYGFRELQRCDGYSVVESFCWDMETNTRVKRTLTVDHRIGLKGGAFKKLTDSRDIYEQVANQAQRRVRACILEIIPGDIVEKAVGVAKKTLVSGAGEPLIDRIKKMVVAFQGISVPQEKIDKHLGHPVAECSHEEIADLLEIYNSVKEGHSRREDWFDFGGGKPDEGGKAAEVSEKLRAPKPAANAPDPAAKDKK
jgi:hypothetical protein